MRGYSLDVVFRVAILVGALAITLTASADEPFSLSVPEVERWAGQLKVFPNAPLSILQKKTEIDLREDGTTHTTVHLIIKVQNEAGLLEISNLNFSYAPWFQQRTEVQARVINDGRQTRVGSESLVESTISSAGLTYSETRLLHLPLPELTVGSIVELVTRSSEHKSAFAAGVIYREDLGVLAPTDVLEIVVTHPNSKKYRVDVLGEYTAALEVTRDVSAGLTQHRVAGKGLVPAPISMEAPAPDKIVRPTLVISTGESWQAVARAYDKIVESRVREGLSLPALARFARGQTGSTKEKIQAALAFVHENLRYTGMDLGASTLEPDALNLILERGYGDCKDQSLLLVSLLRQLDIKAHVALISTQSAVPASAPGISAFNHAIVYVPGEDVWVDPTDHRRDIRQLGLATKGRLALIAAPHSDALVTTPQGTALENQYTREVSLLYSETDSALITDNRSYRGAFYHSLTGPDGVNEAAFLERMGNAFKGSREGTEFSEDELNSHLNVRVRTRDAGQFATDKSGRRFVVEIGSALEVVPLQFKPEYPGVLDQLKASISGTGYLVESRGFYVPTLATYRLVERHIVEDHHQWTSTPGNFQIEGPVVSYKFINEVAGNELVSTFEVTLHRQDVGLADIETESENYKQVLDRLKHNAQFEPRTNVLMRDKQQQAFQLHRKLIQDHPDDPMHFIRYATDLRSVGLVDIARRALEQAANLHPADARVFYELGLAWSHNVFNLYDAQGTDLALAALSFQKAIELDPVYFDAYDQLVNAVRAAFLFGDAMPFSLDQVRATIDAGLQSHLSSVNDHDSGAQGTQWHMLIEIGAAIRLMQRKPQEATEFILKYGTRDRRIKAMLVTAQLMIDPGEARALASRLGLDQPHTIIGAGLLQLMEFGWFEELELAQRIAPAGLQQAVAMGVWAAKGEGCAEQMGKRNRLLYDSIFNPREPLIPLSAYPTDLQGIVGPTQWNEGQRMRMAARYYHAGGARSAAKTERALDYCQPKNVVTRVGDLALVRTVSNNALGFFIIRDETPYFVAMSHEKDVGRLIEYLKESGRRMELAALLDHMFDPGKMHRNSSLRAFSSPDGVPQSAQDFFIALARTDAGETRIENIETLQKPPANFNTPRHKRALQKLIVDGYPPEFQQVGVALSQSIFMNSDQSLNDWTVLLDRLWYYGDVSGFNETYAEFEKAYGSEDSTVRRHNIYRHLLNENIELLVDSALESKTELTPRYINELAWYLLLEKESLEAAHDLLLGALVQGQGSPYAHQHTYAVILAVLGRPAEAFDTIQSAQSNLRTGKVSEYEKMIVYLIARSLDYDDYADEVKASLQHTLHEDLISILDNY